MITIAIPTDEELALLSTERLTELAFAAAYSGTDEDAQRVGRVLRARRQYRQVEYRTAAWALPFDPDDWMGEDLMKE